SLVRSLVGGAGLLADTSGAQSKLNSRGAVPRPQCPSPRREEIVPRGTGNAAGNPAGFSALGGLPKSPMFLRHFAVAQSPTCAPPAPSHFRSVAYRSSLCLLRSND